MPYSLIASVVAAALAIRFLLDEDNTYRAKALVMLTLFVALLVPLWRPSLAVHGLLAQTGLALFLLLNARYRGNS